MYTPYPGGHPAEMNHSSGVYETSYLNTNSQEAAPVHAYLVLLPLQPTARVPSPPPSPWYTVLPAHTYHIRLVHPEGDLADRLADAVEETQDAGRAEG